jgi:hypothetical protein
MRKKVSDAAPLLIEQPNNNPTTKIKLKESHKLEKWDALFQAMTVVLKCKNYKTVIKELPKLLENLIEYDKFSILIISKHFDLDFSEDLISGKVFFNGMWYKILSTHNHPCSKPQFSTLTQLIAGKKK